MEWGSLIENAFQPPVLVALIAGGVSLVGGRWLIRSKDEQIKAKEGQIASLERAHAAEVKVKDERIAALERWMPAKQMEQVEAIRQGFELLGEQQAAQIETLKAKLEEDQGLSAFERDQLQKELDRGRSELKKSQEELVAARQLRDTSLAESNRLLSDLLGKLQPQRPASSEANVFNRRVTKRRGHTPPKPINTREMAQPRLEDLLIQQAEVLIVKGKDQGYLTPDDALDGFPDLDTTEPEQILRIFAAFKEMGIEVTYPPGQ